MRRGERLTVARTERPPPRPRDPSAAPVRMWQMAVVPNERRATPSTARLAREVVRRLASSKPPQSLIVDVFRRAPRQAPLMIEFVWIWWLAEDLLERRMSPEELPELCGMSPRTVYRRLEAFRRAFPDVRTPGELPRA